MSTENCSTKRIGVISGRFPNTTFLSSINHKAYCKRHNYTYIHCNWPTGAKNPYMNKMRFIQEYYHLFDYIFWIDDDAFFMDINTPLTDFLPSDDKFLSICSSPDYKKIHTYISSGQFFLRCDEVGRSFIDSIEETNLSMVKEWWNESLGFFSNGDQDAMVYHMKTNPHFSNYDRHHFSKFNSRVEDFLNQEKVFILHFTGTVKVKNKNYKKIINSTSNGPTLLPEEFKETLQYQDPKPFIKKVLLHLKNKVTSH